MRVTIRNDCPVFSPSWLSQSASLYSRNSSDWTSVSYETTRDSSLTNPGTSFFFGEPASLSWLTLAVLFRASLDFVQALYRRLQYDWLRGFPTLPLAHSLSRGKPLVTPSSCLPFFWWNELASMACFLLLDCVIKLLFSLHYGRDNRHERRFLAAGSSSIFLLPPVFFDFLANSRVHLSLFFSPTAGDGFLPPQIEAA